MFSTDDSGKVHSLSVIRPEQARCAKTIETLKEALAEAERGEIQEMFLLARTNYGWRQLATPTDNFPGWIGRLEVAKSDWIDNYKANRDN